MKKSLRLGLMATTIILTALLANSCVVFLALMNEANKRTETRPVGAFTSIKVDGPGQISLYCGKQEVIVKADYDVISSISTTVSGSQLTIHFSPDPYHTASSPFYHVTIPSIEGLTISDSCFIAIQDIFSGSFLSCVVNGSGSVSCLGISYDTVTLSSSGSGSFAMNVTASSLYCDLSSTNDSYFQGSATSATFSIAGSGGVLAQSLGSPFTAANMAVNINGSGSVLIGATSALNVAISGSGSVHYWGNPAVSQEITGTGSVVKSDIGA